MTHSLLDRVRLQVQIRNLIKVYGYTEALNIIHKAIETETRCEKEHLDRTNDLA